MNRYELSRLGHEPTDQKSIRKTALRLGGTACAVLSLLSIGADSALADKKASCWNGPGVYSYAGVKATEKFDGLEATITELAEPQIANGHVSAWIGFGGIGLGPGGSDEWLQAGLDRESGQLQSDLYYEIALPNQKNKFVNLGTVALGIPEHIRLTKLSKKPERWQLDINGRRRGPIFSIPADHRAWPANFTAESWTGSKPGCNSFAYTFGNLRMRQSSTNTWQPPHKLSKLKTRGYTLKDVTDSRFVTTAQFNRR